MSLWFRATLAGVVLLAASGLSHPARAAKAAEQWISDASAGGEGQTEPAPPGVPVVPADLAAAERDPADGAAESYVSDRQEDDPTAVTGGEPCDEGCADDGDDDCTRPVETCSPPVESCATEPCADACDACPAGGCDVAAGPLLLGGRRGLFARRSYAVPVEYPTGGCESGVCGQRGCGAGGCELSGCGMGGCGLRGCLGCCLHRGSYLDRWFNCSCDGSYKFPVPPLYTYHWPGLYSQQLMTDYHSPWRFPPLRPYTDESPILPEDELAQQEPSAGVRSASFEKAVESQAAGGRGRISVAEKLEQLYGERD